MLGVRFRRDAKDPSKPEGMAALYINEEKVAEARLKVQPGKFSLAGEGLNIGCDRGQAVTQDYRSPFPFTGGTIKKVIVDVSGERYRDVNLEYAAMLMRD